MKPKVTFLVNITPNESMMVQAHLFAESVKNNSGTDYEIIWAWDHGYSYDDVVSQYRWIRNYNHRVSITPETYNRELGYVGNFLRRFEIDDIDTHAVVIADADTLILQDISSICQFAAENESLLGVPAGTFINDLAGKCFQEAQLSNVNYDIEFMPYGVWTTDEDMRFVPPHFNCGFLYMSKDVLKKIGNTIYQDTLLCKQAMNGHPLYTQMGITVAIIRSGIRYDEVSLKYNMTAHGGAVVSKAPDHSYFKEKCRRVTDAIENPKVIHYCVSNEHFSKARDFRTYDSLKAFAIKDVGHDKLSQNIQAFVKDNTNIFPEI